MYGRHDKLTLARIIVTITLGCAITYETNGDSIEESHTVTMSDIGVPVQSVNWVRLHPGRNHEDLPCLYATMGQTADNLFVLQIDPETGECRQFIADVPRSNFPTATLLSRSDKLYIGAAYSGHLLCFDPSREVIEDLGAIHPGKATFPCRLDEDEKGRIWIGSYGTADLTCYNSHEGKFTRYGRMDKVDMYNYPFVNSDGKVACLIRMTQPHVVVFDSETGKKKAYYRIVGDGSCYTLANLKNQKLIAVGTSIAGGSGTQPKIDQAILFLWDYHAEKTVWAGTLDRKVAVFNALLVGADGRLYGTVRGGGSKPELFVFDPTIFEFVARIAVPEGDPLDLGLQNGPNGKIYGFTRSCIYQINPDSLTVKVINSNEGQFSVAGPILGKYIYFATGHRLRAARILEQ